ncbi:MAG: PAS domain-containing protein, partial [Solirubrobacterales bacterium]|nr:PAS domain-containing protein [Solirubrobacterales bacterium]
MPRWGAEEALATLDEYLERAPVGFVLFDVELRFVRANAALAKITGRTPEEHLGRAPAALLGAVGAEVERELQRVRATDEPRLDLELAGRLPSSPGEERRWLMSFYRARLPDGDAHGIGATVVETTDQLRFAQELTAQRDLYETLLRARSQMGEAFVLLE